MGLLAVAAWLEPSPTGIGTHQQLGLPPCTFWMLFGRPCPTCGMTTSWAHLVRGQCGERLAGQRRRRVAGDAGHRGRALAAGLGWRGSWIGVSPNGTAAACIATTILAVTLIDWVIRLLSG